jgi:hypothetical protein
LLCSTLLTACAATILEWETRSREVLVAGESAVYRVPGTRALDSLVIPKDRSLLSRPDAARLEFYRIYKDSVNKVPVTFANGRLNGEFIGGERYLIVLPEPTWIRNKHTLLCRLKLIHADLIRIRPNIMDNICPRILCPADVFLGDRLLDEFVELQGFPNEFPREELRGMELGPLRPGGAGLNLCDQCFGRDWGVTLIPECRGIGGDGPGCKRWVANGPGPNTVGQVENIANREVVGAVNAVAPHPTDANTAYVGAVNGGLWRATNATVAVPAWTPLSDTAPSLSIGALEFDPTDATRQTLLAGIGRFSSLLSRGGARAGLLRTTNGVNFTTVDDGGVLRGLNIAGVAPRGATLVIAANAADALANRGVWRSTDTGATWTQISGAAGSGLPAGATFDLASDPGNAARLFANAGNGLFRSTDTGATWARVSNAAMDALLGAAGNVDIAVGNANNVFVAIVGVGRLTGLFRSGDGGGTWAALDLPRTTENAGAVFGIHPGGQGATHLSIASDPTNANIVYVGGDRQPCFTESAGCNAPGVPPFPNSLGAVDFSGRLFRVDASRAAGTQAATITHSGTAANSAPHADSRDMDFAADGGLIEGDDGGVYRRTNPRANTGDWFSMNGTLQTTEFHAAAWDSNSNIIIGGAQDTGTPEQQTSAGLTWRSVSTADGGDVAVDDTGTPGTSVRYSSFQFLGNFRRSTVNAANVLQATVFPPLTVVGGGSALVTQFYTPIRLNNVNPNRLIIGGGNSVYESFDQGTTIREIGVGIVVNDTSTDPIAYGATGNADMLYVGSGNRVLIRNAAPPAALTASATYRGGNVNDIAIDPATPNTAFVVDGTSVFRTADGGGTWTNVTGNLDTLGAGTIRSVVFQSVGGAAVVVGTDTGVFIATGPAFNAWVAFGCELPRVPVYDLEFDAQDRVFVAGTLGRGAWVLKDN